MKRPQVLILLILVVFISGCVGQPGGVSPSSNGVIIKSFSPDFSEVRSGEFVPITLSIQNVGESEAKDIKAELFGIGSPEWSFQTGKAVQELSKLVGANPSQNVVGESYEFTWGLTSPSIKVDNVYTADTRVYYRYSTSAIATLTFMTYDYLKSLPTEQQETIKKKAGVSQTKVSGAPVQVVISAGTRPLVIYQETDKFSLQVTINNVGSGNAFSKDASYQPVNYAELNKVKVKVSTPGGKPSISCSGLSDGFVTLTKGKSRTIYCEVTISKSDVVNQRDFTVDISLDYGYFVDSSTTIKVLKSEAPITPAVPAYKDSDGGKVYDVPGTCTGSNGEKKDDCDANSVVERYLDGTECKSETKSCNNWCIDTKGAVSGTCSKNTDEVGYCNCGDVRVKFDAVNCGAISGDRLAAGIRIDDKAYNLAGGATGTIITLSAKDHTINEIGNSICSEKTCEYRRLKCESGSLVDTGLNSQITLPLGSYSGKEVSCVIYYRQERSTISCPP